MLNPALDGQASSSSDLYRQLLKTTFSASQLMSDGLSLGLSIYTQFNNLPVAVIIGFTSGTLSALTTWGFKGPVIDKCFGKPDADKEEIWLSPLTAKVCCWFYTVMRIIQEFGMNYFIFDSVLAWINSFYKHSELRLTAMSPQALLVLFTYTVFINLPFVLSNEIYETCEQIMAQAGITDEKPPMAILIYPLRFFNAFISTVGAITHSLEHLTNLLLLIPPMWIVTLMQLASIYVSLGVAGLATAFGLLFLVHLVQTYFFEGRHAKLNLLSLDHDITSEEKVYKIHSDFEYYALLFSHTLLDTQSVFHAADDARFVLLSLMTMGYPQAAVLLGCFQFIIVCLGIQFSSIYESKEATHAALENYQPGISLG